MLLHYHHLFYLDFQTLRLWHFGAQSFYRNM